MRVIVITAILAASLLPHAYAQYLYVQIATTTHDGNSRKVTRTFTPSERYERISEPSIPKDWACEARIVKNDSVYAPATGSVLCTPNLLIPTTISTGVLIYCPVKETEGADFFIQGPQKTDREIALIRVWCY